MADTKQTLDLGAVRAIRITSPKRAILVECMERQLQRGLSPIMTEGYFLTEAVMTEAMTALEFALGADQTFNGQPIQRWERRLKLNDAFYMTHLSVMWYTFAIDADPVVTQRNRASARLQTFANTRVFGTVNTPQLVAAYRGSLGLSIDETIFIPSLDLMSMYFASDVQEGTAVSAVATTGISMNNSWENDRGFKQLTDPCLRLNGPANTKFSLDFPVTVDLTGVTDVGVACVAYGRGWKAQNGGIFRPANL